jgi:hypothetical protein
LLTLSTVHSSRLDLHLLAVDLLVARDNAAGEQLVGAEDGLAGLLEHVLHHGGHAQRAAAKVVEQVDKVSGHSGTIHRQGGVGLHDPLSNNMMPRT